MTSDFRLQTFGLENCIITVRTLLHKRTVFILRLIDKLLIINRLIVWYVIDTLVP
jgi:hypothetical protein